MNDYGNFNGSTSPSPWPIQNNPNTGERSIWNTQNTLFDFSSLPLNNPPMPNNGWQNLDSPWKNNTNGLQVQPTVNKFTFLSMYVLVMSPSRAGELKDFRLGSAHDLFHFSSELKIDWKTSWNFNFQLKTYFVLFSIIKLTKLWIWIKFSPLKTQKFR